MPMIQAFIPTSYSLDAVAYPNVKPWGSCEAPAAAESLSWQQQTQGKMEWENMDSGITKFKHNSKQEHSLISSKTQLWTVVKSKESKTKTESLPHREIWEDVRLRLILIWKDMGRLEATCSKGLCQADWEAVLKELSEDFSYFLTDGKRRTSQHAQKMEKK